MKVLGIGETVIDRIEQEVNGVHVLEDSTHVGGPVTAALIVLARLGAECHLLTSIGRDAEAQLISELVEHEGIAATFTRQAATKINTMVVNAKTGQRTKRRGTIKHAPLGNLPLNLIHRADLIIIDRHEPQAFVEVMRHKRPGTEVIIDPSTEVSDFTRSMIRLADHPIVPIETLTQLGAHDITTALSNIYMLCQKPIVVTLGEMGSLLYDGRETELIPALEVNAVDTTGAGDVYRGAYAFGILGGWSRQRAAAFANAVAGMQCTRLGNHSAIPSREKLLDLVHTPSPLKDIHFEELNRHYQALAPQIITQTV